MNPTESIIRLAAEQGWGLYEIRPGRLSLEQLFVELTTEDPTAQETGA